MRNGNIINLEESEEAVLRQSSVERDKALEKLALEKASKENLPCTFNALFNYLMVRCNNGTLIIRSDFDTLKWSRLGDRTTVRFYPEVMYNVKSTLTAELGFKPTLSYLANFLLSNFVKNN